MATMANKKGKNILRAPGVMETNRRGYQLPHLRPKESNLRLAAPAPLTAGADGPQTQKKPTKWRKKCSLQGNEASDHLVMIEGDRDQSDFQYRYQISARALVQYSN